MAVYVNSESPHYSLIENAFPNGHPAREQWRYHPRRDIVEKSGDDEGKHLHEPDGYRLGVFGCMFGYTCISDEMKDTELVNLITRLSEQEAMPMVADPRYRPGGIPAPRFSGERWSEPVPRRIPAAYRNRYLA